MERLTRPGYHLRVLLPRHARARRKSHGGGAGLPLSRDPRPPAVITRLSHQIRGGKAGEQEDDRAGGGHVPGPVPAEVDDEGQHACLHADDERPQRVVAAGERVADAGRQHEGDGQDEQGQSYHAQLAEHVEPLAVSVPHHTTDLAKAVVREGERARAGAGQANVARLLDVPRATAEAARC